MAPEVMQNGEVAKRADVYSFAVMLLEMWSGQPAYADENYHSVSSFNTTLLFHFQHVYNTLSSP